jgi:hypothetical protein
MAIPNRQHERWRNGIVSQYPPVCSIVQFSSCVLRATNVTPCATKPAQIAIMVCVSFAYMTWLRIAVFPFHALSMAH